MNIQNEDSGILTLPDWPYLSGAVPALKGVVKSRPEDFLVEEIPQYFPSGEGTHTYFMVEKTGMTTLELLRMIARRLNRKERDLGYAGLKDSRAVTRQVFSIEHIDPAEIQKLEIENVKILWVNRHTNKIKLGHLAGNKFQIKLREVQNGADKIAENCLGILLKRGVPNYFGTQRFGIRGDSWIMGQAIIQGDYKALLDQFLGKPTEFDREHIKKARQLYDKGRFELAYQIWPGYFRDPKKALRSLMRRPTDYHRAYGVIDRKLKKLFVSAYQSYLFNQVLAERIESIDRVENGDLACKHISGGVFLVDDAEKEQLRAANFEISPTGPLYGYRMTFPEGREGEIERNLLESQNMTLEDFREQRGHKIKGSRRPLRVQMSTPEIQMGKDDAGDYLSLKFDLPSGSYATAVLRELMKS